MTRRLKQVNLNRLAITLLVGLVTSVSSVADDVDDGITAYKQQDYQTAINTWQRAAQKDNPNAHYNLGQLYRLGHGVDINYHTAKSYYERAAKKNHLLAQINLGTMYYFSKLGPDQYVNAFYWLHKAAQQNDPHAQWMTGVMLFNGQGVAQDSVTAYSWLTLASLQNHPQAIQDQIQLKSGLSPEQISIADELTTAFNKIGAAKELPPQKVIKPEQYRVQVGSFKSANAAETALTTLTKKAPKLVANNESSITVPDLNSDKPYYYRLQLGAFDSEKEAHALCLALKNKKQPCFMVKVVPKH